MATLPWHEQGAGRAIRICHVAMADLWAGAEVQLAVLARSLVTFADLEVSAVLLNEGRLACELRRLGIETTVISEARHGSWSIARKLLEHFRCRDIDIVHTHDYKDNVLTALVSVHGNVRWRVRTVHGRPEHHRGLRAAKQRMYHRIDAAVLQWFAHRIIAVSFDLRAELMSRFGGGRVVCIQNGIDLEQLDAAAGGDDLRGRPESAGGPMVIGTLGRLVPIKGLDVFLRAAELIRRRRPGVKFLIAGEGPSRPALEALARRCGLGEDVLFLGHRDDPYDVLRRIDIFVLPSLAEGIPMTLLEAMALRRPVVASRAGGIAEVIEDGVSGVLVTPGREDEIAERCVALLDRADFRESLGTAGRQRVHERFGSRVMAERVAGVYRGLVGREELR